MIIGRFLLTVKAGENRGIVRKHRAFHRKEALGDASEGGTVALPSGRSENRVGRTGAAPVDPMRRLGIYVFDEREWP